MNVWKKIREDGTLGLYAVVGGLGAAGRRGAALPGFLRLRWRLRETDAALDAVYEEFGRLIAGRLNAGGVIEPADDQAQQYCRRIESLLAEARRLRDELAAHSWG
jgi:hypothetical protein